MAEYCTQCSAEMDAPEGWSDFVGLVEDTNKMIKVLCEGCGWTFVDANGSCVSADCLVNHGGV